MGRAGGRVRLVLTAAVVVLAAGCGDLVAVTTTGSVELAPPPRTSVVQDADGGVLVELHGAEDREPVPLSAVPDVLRDAVIAAEDARFRAHGGVDVRALVRALIANARHGKITQGGSTITQQLAKNAVTGNDRTLARKVEEAAVAVRLERELTKDEILEEYLNLVYFGDGAYGVQAASEHYFGRSVEEIDLPRAALLAGLLRAPATTDPLSRPERARASRNRVLDRMVAAGMLDASGAAAARSADLGLAPTGADDRRAPWFLAATLEALQHDDAFAALGPDAATRADRIHRGGLVIETTLDPRWQAAAEEAVARTVSEADDPRAAVVAIDPATGAVRAMVGGRSWGDPEDPTSRFNLATRGRRQPGSVFKEVVLAAALEAGWSLDSRIDAPARATFAAAGGESEPWVVDNYGGAGYGRPTLAEATAMSVNTAYAHLVDELGAERVVEMAARLGVTSDLRPLRSIALGAQEVTVLEMASVQATLAAGGVRRPPSLVTRITAPDGTVLYERPEPRGTRVLDADVAAQVTAALSGVVGHGTGTRADLRRPLAGKTGTTQDSADAWFAGYTPDLAAAVWVGFPDGRVSMEPPRTRIRVEGGTWPAEIFARFGLRALADTPVTDFPAPEAPTVTVRVDTTRDCLPTAWTPPEDIGDRDYPEGSEPTAHCDDDRGPVTADVPDVAGQAWEEARAALTQAGLTAVAEPVFTRAAPPGFVVGQLPTPGPRQTLTQGWVVHVRISSADRTPVAVPGVVGLPVEEARRVLADAGFPVDVTVEATGPADAETAPADAGTGVGPGAAGTDGTVYEQTPGTGSVPRHTLIDLRVR